ncbi:hypothetical protein BCR32DRAFT_285871 [Anaeromyces robustus]|uniref:Uncharacterized protein n=1 Tax=Anaeromyces robustus TaxID=1754192 RepID=A0A1Y1WBY6_9FUNG|nr:hypothetical protein BCR32DRAFT_285871 [Anaeromyces robustus]|eukprot:ORX71059.1 hypothetical protein BCR32DRAFT_285871 [Anaeromyces robustus]
MNWKFLVLFFTYIIIVYCEYIDYAVEELAALVLSAGNEDGSIAKEAIPYVESESDVKTRPILIDVTDIETGGVYLDIQEIIPSLRGLEGDELEKKFKELYDLATVVFNTFMDPDTEEQDRPGNINTYDVLRDIITTKDKSESIGLCNNNVKTRIIFVPNDSDITMMKHFIYNAEKSDFINIDINDFDKLSKDITSSWKSGEFPLISEEFSKAITIKCILEWSCRKNFIVEEDSNYDVIEYLDNIAFNIIETTDENGHLHYTLILINDNKNLIYNAFTLEYDGKKYTTDEKFPPKYIDYGYISYNVGGYHITLNEETNNIERDGIRLISACGISFVNQDENTNKQQFLTPKDYTIDGNDNAVEGILLTANFANERVFKSFNKGENEANIICDRYDRTYATLKMMSKRFIEKRLNFKNSDSLTSKQLLDLNAIYQLMAIKDIFIDPLNYYQNGMLHYSNNHYLQYMNQMADFEESRYLASYTQSKSNILLGSEASGLKNFAAPVTAYDLNGSYEKANQNITNYIKMLSKRSFQYIGLEKRESEETTLINNWIALAQKYEQIYTELKTMDYYVSVNFLTYFYEALKEFSNRFSNGSLKSRTIDQSKLLTLETYFNGCLRIHGEVFGLDSLMDENGRYLFRNLPHINIEASKNLKLLTNLYESTLTDILRMIDDSTSTTFINTSFRYQSDSEEGLYKRGENNSKNIEINEDQIINEINDIDHNNLAIDERLWDIILDVREIVNAIEIHNNDERTPINGSGAFIKLYRALIEKYKEAYPYDTEVSGMNTDKRENEPDTKLTLESILDKIDENDDLYNYILNDISSTNYLRQIFTYIRLELTDMYNTKEDIDGDTYKKLKDLGDKLDIKLDKYIDYPSHKGHEEEGEHLLEAVTNYNELIVYLYSNGIIDYTIKPLDPLDPEDFLEQMEYIRVYNLIEGISKIMRTNPEIFKLDEDKNTEFQNYLETNSNIAFYRYFNENTKVVEPSASDYSKILGEEVESIGHGLSIIIEKINPEQCIGIEKTIALKKKIIRSQTPLSRYQEEIDDYENLYRELILKLNNKIVDTKYYEDHNASNYRTFINFLRNVQVYDINVNIDNAKNGEDDYFDYSSVYSDQNGNTILNSEKALFEALSKDMDKFFSNDEYFEAIAKYNTTFDPNVDYLSRVENLIDELSKYYP